MQLPSIRSKLLWLLLPALAMAAGSPVGGGSTGSGNGQLNLVTSQQLNASSSNRAAYCKNGDDPDPFPPYTSSLNYTFPKTPGLSHSLLTSGGLDLNQDTYPFDCFIELPGGVFVFEIKGEIDSSLHIVFQIWVEIFFFNYDLGVYDCDLLGLDKHDCTFGIHIKYIDGVAGLFPRPDSDPKYVDLCFEIHADFSVPYSRIKKRVDLVKCFTRFQRPEGIDGIS